MKRTIIITGATSGLGLSLSRRFIEMGDLVYGISRTRKNWKRAEAACANSPNLILLQADVSQEDQVRNAIKKIRKRGPVHILIHSAGYVNNVTRVEKETVREFDRNYRTNLLSAFLLAKYVVPVMRAQKTKTVIINISSMAGKRAVPRLAAYSSSKFGVVALSQAIAKENDDVSLKCFTVCPGGMNTPMRKKVFGVEDAARQQSPDFVADVIMKVIGEKIHVDSGGDIVIRHGKIAAINPVPGA